MRYYFHVRRGEYLFEDREGVDLPTFRPALGRALDEIRLLIEQDMLESPAKDYWMDVVDESGATLASIPFAGA